MYRSLLIILLKVTGLQLQFFLDNFILIIIWLGMCLEIANKYVSTCIKGQLS